MQTDDIARVLNDSAASDWLKYSMLGALKRDPIDAANDAEILSALLQSRAEAILRQALPIASYGPTGIVD